MTSEKTKKAQIQYWNGAKDFHSWNQKYSLFEKILFFQEQINHDLFLKKRHFGHGIGFESERKNEHFLKSERYSREYKKNQSETRNQFSSFRYMLDINLKKSW
jgi:hypothetical protein